MEKVVECPVCEQAVLGKVANGHAIIQPHAPLEVPDEPALCGGTGDSVALEKDQVST